MFTLKRILNWLLLRDSIEARASIPSAKPLTTRRKIGNSGEDHAATLLKKRGDSLVARNWSCKSGELDLVSWNENTLVFTEVRTRSSSEFGTPLESVNTVKQERLRRAALAFLSQRFPHGKLPSCRYDVVWIVTKDGSILDSGIIVSAFI